MEIALNKIYDFIIDGGRNIQSYKEFYLFAIIVIFENNKAFIILTIYLIWFIKAYYSVNYFYSI